MLFEPCGDLRKDYGAFCEVLRRTEREDIYGAIRTRTELEEGAAARKAKAAREGAAQTPPGKPPHAAATPAEGREAQRLSFGCTPPPPAALPAAGGDGEAGDTGAAAAAAAAAAAPAVEKPTEAAADPKAATKGRKASKRKSAPSAAGGGAEADEAAQRALAEELQKPFVPPDFTLLELRYPTFCLNSRDMLPLTRAIPHCGLLAALRLVGCGLSVESYGQLVEAVYKNPNVLSVSVDFNDGVAAAARWPHGAHAGQDPFSVPGFTPDPTIRPHSGIAEAASASVSATTAITTTATTPVAGGGDKPEGEEPSLVLGDDQQPPLELRQSSAGASATSGVSAASLFPGEDPHALYLHPSEFCGLHLQPTQLEEQINEERERKGKVDPKKLQQLQQQKEALEEFDRTHRVRVPRAWYGMLYCGIRHLSLRGNAIDDAALRPIARLLQAPHTRLLSLNLWGNSIGDGGAALLAEALQHNYMLRALDLGHNRIGDRGLLDLVDAFRVAEVPTMEEVALRRAKVLGREGATAEERAAAETAAPTVLPTYRDWYTVWWTQHHGAAAEEAAAAAGGGAKKEPAGSRKASSGRGKAGKGEAAPLRPTQPFDRDCVRVDDRTIRVPGNTVLEVLNLSENGDVTLAGAREACRRLQLREPAPADLPQAQQLPNPSAPAVAEEPPAPTATAADGEATPTEPLPLTAGPPAPTDAVLRTPERYCTEMRLRTCLVGSYRSTALETWGPMAEVQRQIHAALDAWAPTPPTAAGDAAAAGGAESEGAAAAAAEARSPSS